jgi:hypothetical protein
MPRKGETMTSKDKSNVVIAMWVITTILSLAVVIDRPINEWVVLTMVALVGAAMVGSIAITTGVRTVEDSSPRQRTQALGKAKNSDMALVDRLIESMSEEELAALRQRLGVEERLALGDDGELVEMGAGRKRRG